jgi:cyclase
MNKITIGAGAGFALALMASAALAQGAPAGPPPQAPMTVKVVKPGLFMVVGNGGNTTVRVGKDALIVVDTKNPGDAIYAELIHNIQSQSSLPVKYVFITHHHADHSGNTINFQQGGATVIAHEGEKAQLANYAPAGGARKPADPSVTYAKTYEVKVNGASARAYHFDAGHTGGDTIVYFPDEKVVAMGDELVAVTPNVDYPYGGSVLGWQKSLAEVAKLDFDTAIPGHGADPMTRAQFVVYQQKWTTLVERGRAAVKAGTPKEQILAAIKTDDLGWNINTPQWQQPARLDAFYADLSK